MNIREALRHKKKDLQAAILFLGVLSLLVFASIRAYREYMRSAPYVSNERYPIRGIDISRHNYMMNLDAAAGDGIEFVFIKASEGKDHRDENFQINYDKAGHAGLKRGAYHFFRFDKDGTDQAQNFMRVVGDKKLELGVAIDIEETGNAKGVPRDSILIRLQDMVDYLNLKGYRVMFYTNRDGYEDFLMNNYAGMPLWICHFSSTPFDADWTFWQFDHHGKVEGIPGEVDMNVFIGSRKDWETYLNAMDPDIQ
ncbi:MAG: hypothetical protein K2N05_08740 [Muribaculaceae bacterium]|nr:hypothetical protein [Muribaculaceae bacterium]